MQGTIYLHRSTTEKLVYIGQTMYFEERWDQHVLAAFIGSTTRFHQAIRRLGPSDFTCEILAQATSRAELNALEKHFIAEYRATEAEYGYNIRAGGQAHRALTPEDVMITQKNQRPPETLPLYNCYGERIGDIQITDALAMHGIHLQVRARGTGKRRHFTCAKLYARKSQIWKPRMSGPFVVLQLIRA